MTQIFGDTTDDITFGNSPSTPKPKESAQTHVRQSTQHRSFPEKKPLVREHAPQRPTGEPRNTRNKELVMPEPTSLSGSLRTLIDSMKPSYLPNFIEGLIRVVIFSDVKQNDPLMLVRSDDVTLLFGTGFGSITNANKEYDTFPDLRLIASEKDRLAGWVLTQSSFNISLFQAILEYLNFPFVYGTRDVIAYIRNNISDANFLEKCRFFEILSPGMNERKIAHFTLIPKQNGLLIQAGNKSFLDTLHTTPDSPYGSQTQGNLFLTKTDVGFFLENQKEPYLQGDIIDIISSTRTSKQTLRFTFDTFYVDALSIGLVAGYTLKDRVELASNGVLTFVLEEDVRSKAIVGHIFIDSRGFVHSYEMMGVHKEILKAIRYIYETTITANPRIERGDLVQTLRREITKYCYLLTGRTPVVMPVIIER